jgi:trans-aconitate 2-methyltransferase
MPTSEQNWNAPDYARNSSAQAEWAGELIGKLKLRGQETVLDIGCGNGAITARLAALLPEGRVVGIDASADMIRLAREEFPAERHPQLRFLLMDASEIRLAREFDAAFSNAVLHWVADQVAVLKGVASCLRRGGRILFQLGGRGNAVEILRTIEVLVAETQWRSYFESFVPPYHFHGPEEYEGWLSECGMQPIRVELIAKDMRHSGPEGLKGWLRTTWFPYTDPLPPRLRERFLEELVAAYLKVVPPDAEGRTHVAMVRLEVEALAG